MFSPHPLIAVILLMALGPLDGHVTRSLDEARVDKAHGQLMALLNDQLSQSGSKSMHSVNYNVKMDRTASHTLFRDLQARDLNEFSETARRLMTDAVKNQEQVSPKKNAAKLQKQLQQSWAQTVTQHLSGQVRRLDRRGFGGLSHFTEDLVSGAKELGQFISKSTGNLFGSSKAPEAAAAAEKVVKEVAKGPAKDFADALEQLPWFTRQRQRAASIPYILSSAEFDRQMKHLDNMIGHTVTFTSRLSNYARDVNLEGWKSHIAFSHNSYIKALNAYRRVLETFIVDVVNDAQFALETLKRQKKQVEVRISKIPLDNQKASMAYKKELNALDAHIAFVKHEVSGKYRDIIEKTKEVEAKLEMAKGQLTRNAAEIKADLSSLENDVQAFKEKAEKYSVDSYKDAKTVMEEVWANRAFRIGVYVLGSAVTAGIIYALVDTMV